MCYTTWINCCERITVSKWNTQILTYNTDLLELQRKFLAPTYGRPWTNTLKKEENLKNEDDLKNKDDLKNEDNLKNEKNLKNKEDLKNKDDH